MSSSEKITGAHARLETEIKKYGPNGSHESLFSGPVIELAGYLVTWAQQSGDDAAVASARAKVAQLLPLYDARRAAIDTRIGLIQSGTHSNLESIAGGIVYSPEAASDAVAISIARSAQSGRDRFLPDVIETISTWAAAALNADDTGGASSLLWQAKIRIPRCIDYLRKLDGYRRLLDSQPQRSNSNGEPQSPAHIVPVAQPTTPQRHSLSDYVSADDATQIADVKRSRLFTDYRSDREAPGQKIFLLSPSIDNLACLDIARYILWMYVASLESGPPPDNAQAALAVKLERVGLTAASYAEAQRVFSAAEQRLQREINFSKLDKLTYTAAMWVLDITRAELLSLLRDPQKRTALSIDAVANTVSREGLGNYIDQNERERFGDRLASVLARLGISPSVAIPKKSAVFKYDAFMPHTEAAPCMRRTPDEFAAFYNSNEGRRHFPNSPSLEHISGIDILRAIAATNGEDPHLALTLLRARGLEAGTLEAAQAQIHQYTESIGRSQNYCRLPRITTYQLTCLVGPVVTKTILGKHAVAVGHRATDHTLERVKLKHLLQSNQTLTHSEKKVKGKQPSALDAILSRI